MCVCVCVDIVREGKKKRSTKQNESSKHVGISKMNLIGAASEWKQRKKKIKNKNATLSHRRIIVWGRTISMSLFGSVPLRRRALVLVVRCSCISVCMGPMYAIRVTLNTGWVKLIQRSMWLCVIRLRWSVCVWVCALCCSLCSHTAPTASTGNVPSK